MTWLFWILAALLSAISVAVLVRALLRRPPQLEARKDYDLTVFKDQLAEIARDCERGVLSESEAAAARLEVQRRILASDASGEDGASDAGSIRPRAIRRLTLATAFAVPLGALGLYLMIGSPDTPSVPWVERSAEVEEQREMAELAGQLRRRLEQNPEDSRGWELLARTYGQLGRHDEAAAVYRCLMDAQPERADLPASYGEALMLANEGAVRPEALAAFERTLAIAPGDPWARYYKALALAQAGDAQGALDLWLALARETPADAPWRGALEARIGETAEALGLDAASVMPPPAVSAPGPSPADMAAVESMSEAERTAFIESMVEQLATRLESEPDNLDGWLRLTRAYLVLGERDQALAALQNAAGLTEGLAADDPRRQAVEEGLKLLSPQK
jgi:cytochrome c-type biogenesis protein CcmH